MVTLTFSATIVFATSDITILALVVLFLLMKMTPPRYMMSPTKPVYNSSFLPTWTQLSGSTSISPNTMAEDETQQSPLCLHPDGMRDMI